MKESPTSSLTTCCHWANETHVALSLVHPQSVPRLMHGASYGHLLLLTESASSRQGMSLNARHKVFNRSPDTGGISSQIISSTPLSFSSYHLSCPLKSFFQWRIQNHVSKDKKISIHQRSRMIFGVFGDLP